MLSEISVQPSHNLAGQRQLDVAGKERHCLFKIQRPVRREFVEKLVQEMSLRESDLRSWSRPAR